MSVMYDPNETVEVFYSYSRKDESLMEQLQSHLATLRHEGRITDGRVFLMSLEG